MPHPAAPELDPQSWWQIVLVASEIFGDFVVDLVHWRREHGGKKTDAMLSFYASPLRVLPELKTERRSWHSPVPPMLTITEYHRLRGRHKNTVSCDCCHKSGQKCDGRHNQPLGGGD